MIQLIGILLILFAGLMIGFVQAAKYADRTKQLRELLHLLKRLETEIGYGHTPLPQALRQAAGHGEGGVKRLFRDAADRLTADSSSFRDVWQRTLEEGWGRTALKNSERSALQRLGESLGLSDREDQAKHLRLAMLQIQTEEETARDEQVRYGKMWKSLGILTAALVVILIV